VSAMSKDLVEKLRMSSGEFSPPVRSLMDIDFYKLTMGQVIAKKYPGVHATFKLIVRENAAPIGDIISEAELSRCLDYAMGLRFAPTDLYYLRGIDLYDKYMFREAYIDYLRTFRLPPYALRQRAGGLELTFSGPWADVTMWETIALAIISELYYRAVMRKMPRHELQMIYDRARVRIYSKLEKLLRHPDIKFADFGQRRRHSFLWQEWVLGICKEMMGAQFTGTSNTWMAFHHNLAPVGTNAHEVPMVRVALANSDEEKIAAQYEVLREWESMYGPGLRIMLPDTYTSEQFFRNAPDWVAKWRGLRQDSGDPITRGWLYINWLQERGVDPREKVIIFSDGLDVDKIIELRDHFAGRINTAFGWGTLLTNDFRNCHANPLLRPFSMVCKVVEADGRPCVKLSDSINKATGPLTEIERYKEIFRVGARTSEAVLV
jgi:nicotinate phosphoribosyltransferase